jgi:hypothetical protein
VLLDIVFEDLHSHVWVIYLETDPKLQRNPLLLRDMFVLISQVDRAEHIIS